MPAYYDFFRKIKFLPNDVSIEADSVTDTAQIEAGTNIAFDVEDSTEGPGFSTDKVVINGPVYDVYLPVVGAEPGAKATIRLERAALGTTSAVLTDIEIKSDPLSPILINRTGTNTITIGSSSPTLPFSQEQIEDFAAGLLQNGSHSEITVNYDDLGSWPNSQDQDSTTGAGTSALFDITIVNNEYFAVVTNPGSGYVNGDTVTIFGTNFVGGATPLNDIVITISSVDGSGGILSYSSIAGTPPPSANIDLTVTSTLEQVTGTTNGRVNAGITSNAISITNATGSTNSTTGALKVTGGLGVFENVNVGGNIATATGTVSATRLISTVATGTAPLEVTSTTAVANLQAATASKWHSARTITLGGDLSGNVSIDGSGDVTLNATVVADSVALGTDTTGNYVAAGAVSGNGLSGGVSSEGATFTVSSNATSVNTPETIIFRDLNGDFAARTISLQSITKTGVDGTGDIGQSGNKFGTIYATNFSGLATNVSGIVAVVNGGTGASTAETGLSNLGGVPLAGGVNMTGSLYTRGSFGMRSSSIVGNPIMYDVQDQAGATVLEIGRADNVAATTAIDIHTGATSVDYDTRLEFTGGTGVIGNGAMTIRAASVTLAGSGTVSAASFSGNLTGSVTGGSVSATTVTASDTITFNASAIEEVSVQAAAASGTVTLDCKTNSVFYYTSNATGNWTLNFRGDGTTTMNTFLAAGKSATVVFLATQGATAYYPTAFQVDGSAVTPRWLGGSAPTGGNATGIDSYSFTIIKTAASTYTVLASQARFA
jgi:hypothetical protein